MKSILLGLLGDKKRCMALPSTLVKLYLGDDMSVIILQGIITNIIHIKQSYAFNWKDVAIFHTARTLSRFLGE